MLCEYLWTVLTQCFYFFSSFLSLYASWCFCFWVVVVMKFKIVSFFVLLLILHCSSTNFSFFSLFPLPLFRWWRPLQVWTEKASCVRWAATRPSTPAWWAQPAQEPPPPRVHPAPPLSVQGQGATRLGATRPAAPNARPAAMSKLQRATAATSWPPTLEAPGRQCPPNFHQVWSLTYKQTQRENITSVPDVIEQLNDNIKTNTQIYN